MTLSDRSERPKYWLADWMETVGIRNTRDLVRAIADERKLANAVDIAATAASQPIEPVASVDVTGLVGRRLDLSGIGSCGHPSCIQKQLDQGLADIWHYFDRLVVEGLGPRQFVRRSDSLFYAREALLTHTSTFMHARKIGALPYMSFREKPLAFCADHYRQHAKEVGLPITLNGRVARALISQLEREGTIDHRELLNGYVAYFFSHPLFESGLFWLIPPGSRVHPTAKAMAKEMFSNACVATIGDVVLAGDLGCPLVSNTEQIMPIQARHTPGSAVDTVALSVRLPVLFGATSEQVLKLREEHLPEYAKFRAAMLRAIRERLDRQDQDPGQVARDVRREFVEPALADVESRMRLSLRRLSSKAAFGVALGAAIVTVGTLASAPLVIGTGVATAASTALDVKKFFDDRGDVQLSDMYFLWIARRKVKRHKRSETDLSVTDAYVGLLADHMLSHGDARTQRTVKNS